MQLTVWICVCINVWLASPNTARTSESSFFGLLCPLRMTKSSHLNKHKSEIGLSSVIARLMRWTCHFVFFIVKREQISVHYLVSLRHFSCSKQEDAGFFCSNFYHCSVETGFLCYCKTSSIYWQNRILSLSIIDLTPGMQHCVKIKMPSLY